ncbi:MAG: rod shape-determining protein MreC [Rhodospirillales bacterium]|nr:MAG: rod shape-determining protein MreC [Rhodospirillales bacterium]
MALRKAVVQTAASVRHIVQRFSLALLVVAAAGAMLIGKADTVILERARAATLDVVAPILEVMSRPVAVVNDFIASVEDLANLRSENARLREENARLLAWQSVARRLETENAELRALGNFRDGPQATFITGRVVGDSGSAFVRSMLLNVGRRAGVTGGQAVITGEGLIGRVTDVGDGWARVLLLSDLSFRLPVLIERTRERAILTGDNSPMPKLALIQSVAGIQTGDRIVTSGHGGSFPVGIPVGVVVSVGDSGIRVRPLSDLSRIEFVRVVDYGIAGLVTSPQAPAPPPAAAPTPAAPAAPKAATTTSPPAAAKPAPAQAAPPAATSAPPAAASPPPGGMLKGR